MQDPPFLTGLLLRLPGQVATQHGHCSSHYHGCCPGNWDSYPVWPPCQRPSLRASVHQTGTRAPVSGKFIISRDFPISVIPRNYRFIRCGKQFRSRPFIRAYQAFAKRRAYWRIWTINRPAAGAFNEYGRITTFTWL